MQGFSIDAQGPGNVHNLELGRFEFGIVRRKVRQIIGRAGFTSQDREDLEQDLLTRLIQSLASFDPTKAHRNAFVTAVVERHVATLLRNARAAKRDHRRVTNIRMATCQPDHDESSDVVFDIDRDVRRPSVSGTTTDQIDLQIDVRIVLERLPEDLREFASARSVKSMSEVSRESDTPRTTLYHVADDLREHFEAAGLRDYVQKNPGHTSR